MKNAVNSMENLIKVNIEPSLVGNYLEGVTTRVEPKAKAMAIITHSIESNPIEKRSTPDNKGDEIVWSGYNLTREMPESSRNGLTTFGEFNFNMAGTAIRNQVIKMISRLPITFERNIRADMVNIKMLAKLGFSQAAKLTSVVISLAGFRRLLTPVLTLVPLNITLITPVVGASSNGSRTPNLTILRTVFAGCFGSAVSESLSAVRAYLSNQTFIARIILTSSNLTAKLQKAFSATCLASLRFGTKLFATDNTEMRQYFSNAVALFRTILAIPTGKFLATYQTTSHSFIVAQLDSIVN